jgi:glycosyltransferase involved in cell wall biosynthesis
MQILVTHGYLLTGTGSNLYVRNLVWELCKAGHDVYLVCQETHPEHIDYVQDVYGFAHRNTELVQLHSKETSYPGTCRVFRPDLEQFLPVYVFDHYQGFTVKEFPACADTEIQAYIELNRQALMTVLATFPIEIIQTNHTIMFPYIVAQLPDGKRYPHCVTVHGSALNFSVKKDPRLVPYARAGFESASLVTVDSLHAREELCEFLEQHEMAHVDDRVRIIPAGVDVENFETLHGPKRSRIATFIGHMHPVVQHSKGRTAAHTAGMFARLSTSSDQVEELLRTVRASYDYRYVDRDVVEKIRAIDWDVDRVVLYVGKYLWTKGLHLLLLATPLVLERYPRTKFLFVGFGPFREVAEYMVHCLAHQRLDLLQDVLEDATLRDDTPPLPLLADSLQRHAGAIYRALQATASLIKEAVIFTGIIDHAILKYLLPCADVLVAPSVFPEAFGMVAVEALACGVLPIVTYQSAFKEIADVVEDHVAAYGLALPHVPLSADACVRMAQNITAYFAFQEQRLSTEQFQAFKQSLRTIATTGYSWQGIATQYVDDYRRVQQWAAS